MERSLTMAQHAQLYIVASRHPRVGKTLLARLLIEFLRLRGRPLVGYDLKTREPALATCFPNLVWPVDITDTRGQMALFDRIITDHWRTTVIDLGNGSVDQFFKVMAEIGFEREAWQNQIQPVVLYIAELGAVHGANLCRAARTHSWIAEIFGEFRELELQLLASQLEASLRGSGEDKVRQIG